MENNHNPNKTTPPHSDHHTRYGGLTHRRNKHENIQPHPRHKLPKSEGKCLPNQIRYHDQKPEENLQYNEAKTQNTKQTLCTTHGVGVPLPEPPFSPPQTKSNNHALFKRMAIHHRPCQCTNGAKTCRPKNYLPDMRYPSDRIKRIPQTKF